MIEEFAALTEPLGDKSGKVFYSGKDAFNRPSELYILGINPGGDPCDCVLKQETVSSHTKLVLHEYADNWSAYRDESWSGQQEGCDAIQKSLLHLFDGLNMDPGDVPSSNLYFPRSRNADKLGVRHFKKCWPFHKTVVKNLRIRVLVCYGRKSAEFVRRQLMTSPHKKESYKGRIWYNSEGLTVIYARHPSRGGSWENPKNDPTELILKVLNKEI